MNKRELLISLAGLKGAPATVLLALALSDGPLDQDDLASVTGYSSPTVERGLEILLARQLAAREAHGFTALLGELQTPLTPDGREFSPDFPTSQEAHGFTALPGELQTPETLDVQPSQPPPELTGEDLAKKFFSPKKNFFTTTTALNTPNSNNQAAVAATAATAKKIFAILARAGIGKQSRKAQEIAAMGLDPVFVEAHVNAREAALARGERFTPGLLITKILSGDPAPAPEKPDGRICPKCGEKLHGHECLFCAGIIER